MTEPTNPIPPGVDCWVDFNDINDGQVVVPYMHFLPDRQWRGGDSVLAGDNDGNRCQAVITGPGPGHSATLTLDLSTFTPRPSLRALAASAPLSPGERVRGGIRYGQTRPPADPRNTLADRVLASIQDVHARGTQHVDDPRVHTANPVVGCPWCVDQARANALHARLSKRWPDEGPAFDNFEARVLCARGDLARAER